MVLLVLVSMELEAAEVVPEQLEVLVLEETEYQVQLMDHQHQEQVAVVHQEVDQVLGEVVEAELLMVEQAQ